jgi:hypothetical protein
MSPGAVLQLQRQAGNAAVAGLIVQRCAEGEVPAEGCTDCGQGPAVQRLAGGSVNARDPTRPVQRADAGRPMLRAGSRGPAVQELQTRLNGAGAALTADGIFGRRTGGAVRALQGTAGLATDGIVGPRTWAAIDSGVRLPARGGTGPSRGYAALIEQIRIAISSLRGAQPPAAGPRTAMGATSVRDVQREDDEDESWWDQASEAAGSAWDTTTDAAGSAWDATTEAAEGAWDAASESVEDAWDWAGETAGDVGEWASDTAGDAADWASEAAGDVADWASEAASDVGDWVGDAGNAISDAAEAAWNGITETVSAIADEVGAIPDWVRREFADEIAALERIISNLGGGLRLTDDELAALGAEIGHVLAGIDPTAANAAEGGSACTKPDQAVSFATSSFAVDFLGLADLNSKVVGKLNVAGHVDLAAMPSFKVTCWDGTGSSRTVGAAKVTAKGTATFPVPKEPDETKWKTQSADPAREKTGIRDYFNIVQGHESSHVSIYTTAFNGAADQLVGLTESAAKTKFDSIVCESFKSQDSLDNVEGCVVVSNGKDASKAPAADCGLTPNAADSCP